MIFPEPAAREDKPVFSDIPPAVLEQIARIAGADIVQGEIAYGGFSASANFILNLKDGRRVFAKGNHPGEMAHGTQNLRQEISVYESASALRSISPRYLGCAWDGDEDGWMLGVWEGIRISPEPPALSKIVQALMTWQNGAPPDLQDCREKNYISGFFSKDRKWMRFRDELRVRAEFLALFARAQDGERWLERNLPALIALQARASENLAPVVALHGDLHPSNIFQDEAGKAHIVDWPNACKGPAVFDLLLLGACGGDAAAPLRAYAAAGGDPGPSDAALAVAAAMAGFMADQARRAVPLKLPRLRWMQKTILVSLVCFLESAGITESLPRITNQKT